MFNDSKPEPPVHARGWLILGSAGIAAALYAVWAARRARPPGAVGAHAWVVSTDQARREAQWTRQAVAHASGSKGQ